MAVTAAMAIAKELGTDSASLVRETQLRSVGELVTDLVRRWREMVAADLR